VAGLFRSRLAAQENTLREEPTTPSSHLSVRVPRLLAFRLRMVASYEHNALSSVVRRLLSDGLRREPGKAAARATR